MSANIRYRRSGGPSLPRYPMACLEDRQTGAPAIDLDRLEQDFLEQDLESLRARYRTADPYPHIVIDDFFVRAAERPVQESPVLDPQQWNNLMHSNERTFSNTERRSGAPRSSRSWPSPTRRVRLLRERLHRGVEPHPRCIARRWRSPPDHERRVPQRPYQLHRPPASALVAAAVEPPPLSNEDWRPEYGGYLELWNADMTRCAEKVTPVANRVLIFRTDAKSYHGHPEPLGCPEGETRRSLALYYFGVEENPLIRSTDYRPRPGDSAESILIRGHTHLLRACDWVGRRLGPSDQSAGKVLAFWDRCFHRRRGGL